MNQKEIHVNGTLVWYYYICLCLARCKCSKRKLNFCSTPDPINVSLW